jgi:hypothetical protein
MTKRRDPRAITGCPGIDPNSEIKNPEIGSVTMPERNPTFGKIIRGDFHCHPITSRNPDKVLAHLARYMSQ